MVSSDQLEVIRSKVHALLNLACPTTGVQLTQDEQGCLHFETRDGGMTFARVHAQPWGTSIDGQELWKFDLDFLAAGTFHALGITPPPVGTLEPRMVAGLLEF